jgi:hypothetical protein
MDPDIQKASPFAPTQLEFETRSAFFSAKFKISTMNADKEELGRYPQEILSVSDQVKPFEFIVETCNTLRQEGKFQLESYQWNNLPVEAEKYLLPSTKVESQAREIVELTASLRSAGANLHQRISAMLRLLNEKLSFDSELAIKISAGESDTESALDTWHSGKATCSEYTNLFLALARAQGIPARFVSGFSFPTGAHAWAEVFVPDPIGQWLPVDPQLNSQANSSGECRTGETHLGIWATHLKLFGGADFTSIGLAIREWQVRRIELLSAETENGRLKFEGL